MSSDMRQGLYQKYQITKADGSPVDGEYFVLKPRNDLAARHAIMEYANRTKNEQLSVDLYKWMAELAESYPLG